ncbi:MAG: 23S rRNA (guanosine(2251)-2'-O)-methyltransferase RlmB [Negativicutes bacterium]|nr:23S rRNA (guanosine(2251)-2'-O)-methyltransferase RlmB [Negativicutes bacterium]
MEQIEGRYPVLEALQGGRKLMKLYLLQDGKGETIEKIARLAEMQQVPVQWMDRNQLNRLSEGRVHQGVIAEVPDKELVSVAEILAIAAAKSQPPFLLVLDGLEDPGNVGSLIRSAAAAGVHGMIMREKRAAGFTPGLIKATAGAWEYLPIAVVTNISRTLVQLKEAGVWVAGADMTGELIYQANLTGPLAMVIGAEGQGLSRLVKEKCDFLVSLPMVGGVASLNAAVAGALVIYEALRQRGVYVKS